MCSMSLYCYNADLSRWLRPTQVSAYGASVSWQPGPAGWVSRQRDLRGSGMVAVINIV
jgi:hypothetical protein